MRSSSVVAVVSLLVLLAAPSSAGDDPAALAAKARELFARSDYGGALAIWRDLIENHKRHPIVQDGDAHAGAARCLLEQDEFAEAAKVHESYLRGHTQGTGAFNAYVGVFDAWVAAGDDPRAQKAGKTVFKKYPDAKGTFSVLMTWLKHGWKVPRLNTSYKVLHYWAFERIDGSKWPDYRLALFDIIERQHKREDLVKDHTILYCRAWCHLQAKRPAEAIELGSLYLKRQPRGDYADRTRLVMAEAYLAVEPPDVDAAKKQLRIVAAHEGSRQRQVAKDMLARVGAGPTSIQVEEGFPTAEGLGKVVVLTNLGKGHSMRKAIEPWMAARSPEVVTFQGEDVKGAAARLRKHGAEFVAVVVQPTTIDNDFQLAMLELCRDLDDDPMPDFHYGYLTARDADDLGAFVEDILAKEKDGGYVAKDIGVPVPGRDFAGIDFVLHYGHGTARRVVKGVTARDLAKVVLPSHPVVISGACFNGVCSRTHERFFLGNQHGNPDEVPPDEVLSLAWIHAGATGLIAALDGDRGEMASAEWSYFQEHAPPLGEVIGYEYRLVFTSLRESFEAFPRYRPGTAKNKSFYSVMLRGQTSRILYSDPSYRPLHAPLVKPTQRVAVEMPSDGSVTVRVEVLRHAVGPFINTLPTSAGIPFQEVRLYTRAALPEGFHGSLEFPRVDSGGIDLVKVQAKHEVWGGRRYVNLQAESKDGKLARAGTVLTYTLEPVE